MLYIFTYANLFLHPFFFSVEHLGSCTHLLWRAIKQTEEKWVQRLKERQTRLQFGRWTKTEGAAGRRRGGGRSVLQLHYSAFINVWEETETLWSHPAHLSRCSVEMNDVFSAEIQAVGCVCSCLRRVFRAGLPFPQLECFLGRTLLFSLLELPPAEKPGLRSTL